MKRKNLSNKTSYILNVGKNGAQNLDIQHKMLEKDSVEQLKKAGLKQGMVAWDIGCGDGNMTKILASTVGRAGHVYASDISIDQIEIAKQRITDNKLENVSFITQDIDNPKDLEYPKTDIVYSRLLLMHLKNPKKAIKYGFLTKTEWSDFTSRINNEYFSRWL